MLFNIDWLKLWEYALSCNSHMYSSRFLGYSKERGDMGYIVLIQELLHEIKNYHHQSYHI
jgi:hypothetical protein